MIQLFERLLQRWGLIPHFSRDDVLNASIEDKARDTEIIVRRLEVANTKRLEANAKLRRSIQIAKRRTNSFEEFERHLVGRNDQ